MLSRFAKAKIHFIGIGGIGMCGLAELLHNMGVSVKGSDLGENQQTLHLRELGIPIFIGHAAENLQDADVAVYSSAVKSDNVEFRAAKTNGVPLIPRAEALAEIMRLRRGIAIGGTHGKTTTTSMVATVLLHGRLDPTIVIGGRLDLIQSTAKLGAGEWLVAEADESDGSFHRLSPEIAIVTNIDDDHLDHFGSMKHLETAFFEFAMRIPFYGVAIVCGDDERIRKVFKDFPKRIYFYGFDAANDFVASGSNQNYKIQFGNETVASFELQLPGRHNALNATAAYVAGHVVGLTPDKIERGLESYRGVDRRFQKRGAENSVEVYDDYGHHPTEIRAVLAAFREKFPEKTISVLFQPHRYSRTEQCWKDFLSCFKDATSVAVLDIYPAGEKPIPGIDSKRLAAEMDHKNCVYVGSKESGLQKISETTKSGDVVVTLGAGDVWKIGDELLKNLRGN
jgi:UDP-N-acetylmuramate--alanine ligase